MNQADKTLKQNINLLRWVLPVGFVVVSALYQLIIARYVFHNYGHELHWVVEIMFYGTVGPIFTFWILTRIEHWLDEKEHFEREAHASERRLASITNASADAILGIDHQVCIESWNQGAELLFGYSEDEMRGRSFSDLFQNEPETAVELQWLVDSVHRDGFIRGHETNCYNSEGRQIIMDLTATDLAGEHGESIGMSVIMRDITARKQRMEEIQRLNASLNQQVAERTHELAEKVDELAQANADLQRLDHMRSEFVSVVSHQIRAPLTNMLGAVEHMQTSCGKINSTCSRMFTILDDQILRLDHLVQDVLNAARFEAGELLLHPEQISVLPLINQVVGQTGARMGDRTIRQIDKPGLPLVYADRDRVIEVLVNLLDNADKYSPPDENIDIEVRANQTAVTISVRDCGLGIPEGELGRVFNKFYRSDSSDSQIAYGYGLGLYVCRLLVEAQGGRIWAENHPDGGAVLSFTLPVWRG